MKPTLDTANASWGRLRRCVRDYQVAIFVGAGTSLPSRLPSWPGLVAKIGGKSVTHVRAMEEQGVSLQCQLSLYQQSMNRRDWAAKVRECLYFDLFKLIESSNGLIPGLSPDDLMSPSRSARDRMCKFLSLTNPVLLEIVKACSIRRGKRTRVNPSIGAILTTNIDAMLQICDHAHHSSRILRTVERANTETSATKTSVYHLHGYLQPRPRGPGHETPDRLILTDDEYLDRNDNPYSWASVMLHWALREYPVIFVGCSMSDELVRRALLRSRHERWRDLRAERSNRESREERWRRQYAVMKDPKDDAMKEAQNATLARLGVWPLWVSDYENDLLQRMQALGADLREEKTKRTARPASAPIQAPSLSGRVPLSSGSLPPLVVPGAEQHGRAGSIQVETRAEPVM
jgi:hypothetical protein